MSEWPYFLVVPVGGIALLGLLFFAYLTHGAPWVARLEQRHLLSYNPGPLSKAAVGVIGMCFLVGFICLVVVLNVAAAELYEQYGGWGAAICAGAVLCILPLGFLIHRQEALERQIRRDLLPGPSQHSAGQSDR